MVYFKGCSRCSGDMVQESDVFGAYTTCLACGHVTYPEGEKLGARSADLARLQRAAAGNGSTLPFGVPRAASAVR